MNLSLARIHPFLNETLAAHLPAAKASTPSVDCGSCKKALKCCDFQPFVANFLIGAWMESANVEVLPTLRNSFWNPLGLVPAQAYKTRHASANEVSRPHDLRCDFYDIESRRCRIWQFRPGECSSFYCDPEHLGAERQRLSHEVFDFETSAAQMALAGQGFSWREVGDQVDALNEGRPALGGPVRLGIDESSLGSLYKASWAWFRSKSAPLIIDRLYRVDNESV